MPQSMGGLVRYFDEYKSKIEFTPGHIIIMIILVMVIRFISTNFFSKIWQQLAGSTITPMIPGMDPRMMKQAMKKLGIKQEDVDALEVVIKCPDKTIIVSNPSVQQVEMGGQVTFQVAGTISEEERSSAPEISEEDVSTVVEQTSCTKEEARETLEKHSGDLAAAILELQEQ